MSLLRESGRALTSPIRELGRELLTNVIVCAQGTELPQALPGT